MHQIRNSLKYVSSKDRKDFLSDLKKVYQASNKEIVENYLVIKSWQNNWENLSSYFKYFDPIRRIIYTTNAIEGLHWQIRKSTKTKGSFASTNALYKQAYCAIWMAPVQNWALAIFQLDIFLPGRLKIEMRKKIRIYNIVLGV